MWRSESLAWRDRSIEASIEHVWQGGTAHKERAMARQGKEAEELDWDSLGFGLTPAGSMFKATCGEDGEWRSEGVVPWGALQVSPAAQAINYGQAIFEGMKAFRTVSGSVVLFRPGENARRMARGAQRMSMPPVPEGLFLEGVKAAVKANADHCPPEGKGSLYVRPLQLGTGEVLGVAPAPEYTFLVYCSPVSGYFKQASPLELVVEEAFSRAAPGGTGGHKVAGNYSPPLLAQMRARRDNYNDAIFLDCCTGSYIEEANSCNIFAVQEGGAKVVTPPVGSTVLPGITRDSLIQLAKKQGISVEERPLPVHEFLTSLEAFTSGTAVQVSPIGGVTYQGARHAFHSSSTALSLAASLRGIQSGREPDELGWLVPVH